MKVNMVTPWGRRCGIADYVKGFVKGIESEVDVKIIEIANPYSKNPLEFIRLGKEASFNCDLIHVQHEYAQFGRLLFSGVYSPLFYLSLDKNKRVITTLHEVGSFEKGGVKGLARRLYRMPVDPFIFRYSTLLQVHTQVAKETLIEKGFSKERINVIPLGVFKEPELLDGERCKEALGVSGKKVMTLFGLIHRNKGHDLVIDTLPDIEKGVVLIVAGEAMDKGYLKRLKDKVKELGVEERVIFRGYVPEDELPLMFGATDLCILPYRSITQSAAINDIIAYRVPALASALPVFREVAERYGCIETFSDRGELKEKIGWLLSDLEHIESMKRNMGRYLKDHSSEKIVKSTLKMYKSL